MSEDPFNDNFESEIAKQIAKKYKENPTLENYLNLRKEHVDIEFDISTSWSIEWLFSNATVVRELGIDPQTVAGALDADEKCISEVSLQLIELLIVREKLEKSGSVHVQSQKGVLGDSLLNYLISMMLDALSWNDDLHIPRDLVVLIKHRFNADISNQSRAMEVEQKKNTAIYYAAQLRRDGEEVSIRKIAKTLNLNPSSVSRWFKDGELEEEIKRANLRYKIWHEEVKPVADKFKK